MLFLFTLSLCTLFCKHPDHSSLTSFYRSTVFRSWPDRRYSFADENLNTYSIEINE